MKRIPSIAISQRHPKGLFCKTDRLYATVADFIYSRLEGEIGGMLDADSLRRVAITCALFLEDHFSRTHQMEVFMLWHQQKFGTLLPMYKYTDPATLFSKEFQLVLWLAICAERGGNIINPENEGLVLTSLRILSEMQQTGLWDRLLPNEELADHIYCEETQNDIMEIKGVLIWIQHYSFLGYWYDSPEDETIAETVDTLFPEADDAKRAYGIDSTSAFKRQAWPCSLKPQEIYARMIRLEMDDDNDPLAQDIENIEFQCLGAYRLLESTPDTFMLENFEDGQLAVRKDSFGPSFLREAATKTHVFGSFVRFRGEYHSSGISKWVDMLPEHYEAYCKSCKEDKQNMHMEGQFDSFLKKNHGRRTYFFPNFKEYLQWLSKEHKIKNTEKLQLDDDERKNSPLMVFFEPNGQTTLISEIQSIKAPDNPFYEASSAPRNALALILSPMGCSPDCLHYLLENGYLPDAAFNDIKGPEHGRSLVQNNAEFLARCFRRDIRW